MKANELMQKLIALADAPQANSIDTCKAGNPERELQKVATCFIATPEVIRAAAAWGADLLITHEPTYYNHRDFDRKLPDDPVMKHKQALLESTGMTVYRYHDHAHARTPDVIIEGEVRALPWECDHDGHFKVTLHQARTARQIAADLIKYWGIETVRMTGMLDEPMTKVGMIIGAYGDEKHYQAFLHGDCEIMIVGETCEWRIGEYVRDAAQLGIPLALLTCGHVGSEREGMKNLLRLIGEIAPELETKYFECGEVYSCLKDGE